MNAPRSIIPRYSSLDTGSPPGWHELVIGGVQTPSRDDVAADETAEPAPLQVTDLVRSGHDRHL